MRANFVKIKIFESEQKNKKNAKASHRTAKIIPMGSKKYVKKDENFGKKQPKKKGERNTIRRGVEKKIQEEESEDVSKMEWRKRKKSTQYISHFIASI